MADAGEFGILISEQEDRRTTRDGVRISAMKTLGYFDDAQRVYVVTDPLPPQSWVNSWATHAYRLLSAGRRVGWRKSPCTWKTL